MHKVSQPDFEKKPDDSVSLSVTLQNQFKLHK